MSQGIVSSFQILLMNIDSPAKLIYGVILVLIIVYSSIIPSEYRLFADSLLGRVFGIGIIYGVVQTLGWVYGLLTALAFLLILNGSSQMEGFNAGGTVTQKKIVGKRWFVEKVLDEHPKNIATDKVTTNPIQT